jgi:hypothetical protein
MSEVVKLTGKEVLQQAKKIQVYGVIKNIEGDINKVSKKVGTNGNPTWVGTIATITVQVNGVNQKIRVMGCTLDGETLATEYKYNKVKAFALDGSGNIMKDDSGKSISSEIFPAHYNPTTQLVMDRRAVREFTGALTEDGKKEFISHIDEITVGRFATSLINNKSMLIGKQVIINGMAQFKPNQDFTKIDLDIELKTITLRQADEKKEFKEGFRVTSPILMHTSALSDCMGELVKAKNIGKELEEVKTQTLVPVYHKYLTPLKRDGKEIKGRTVYVPMTLDMTNKNILKMVGTNMDMFKKLSLFKKMLMVETGNREGYIAINADMSYKSGVVQRDINMEDLKEDPIFLEDYIAWVNASTQEEKEEIKSNTMIAYKSINPTSVRGEYQQSLEFITFLSNRETANEFAMVGEDLFEIYSLDKIKQENEMIAGNTPTPTPTPTPQKVVIEAVKTSATQEPQIGSQGIDEDSDEFPF